MFDPNHIRYWAHEVAKPTKQPRRTESMLVRIHTLTEEEKAEIGERTRWMFANGPRRRTKRDWDERYPSFHQDWCDHYGAVFLQARLAGAKNRHPVCTNKANGTASSGLPLTRKATVWHLGNVARLRAKRTGKKGSHEGPGLAVSECPVAWSDVAGSAGTLWRLNRCDGEFGQFVDYHAMTPAQRDAYLEEALQQRLVKRCAKWRIATVDEYDSPISLEFSTRKKAEAELDGADDGTVEKFDGFSATPKLDKWWRRYFTRSMATCRPNIGRDQLATLALLTEEDFYDGVWWYDDYDPEGDSAPRGIIFPARLTSWERRREGEATQSAAS